MKRSLALTLVASLLSSCVASGPLPKDFYAAPQPVPTKVPARVAVVTEDVPTEARSMNNGDLTAVVVDVSSYPYAVAAMLGSIYQSVETVGSQNEAKKPDYVVRLGSDYPRAISLSFFDASGASLASFSEKGRYVNGQSPGGGAALYWLFMTVMTAGIFPLIFSGQVRKDEERLAREIATVTTSRLDSIRKSILQTDALMHSPEQKQQLAALASKTEEEASSGDFSKALAAALSGLKDVTAGSDNALRFEAKAAEAAMSLGLKPEIPEEARDSMARGKAAISLAKDPSAFAAACDSMERAVALAPAWAAGHFNTAVAEEAASRWGNAARHLKIYMTLSPAASDREAVRAKIAELELHQQRGDQAGQ